VKECAFLDHVGSHFNVSNTFHYKAPFLKK